MKNIWKKILIAGLSAAVIPLGGTPTVKAAPEIVQPVESEDSESSGGHIPSSIPQYYYDLKGDKPLLPKSRSGSELPKKFSLVEEGLSTVIKDQSPWGSCWSFGTLSSLEGNTLINSRSKSGGAKSTPDYSERHLAWFAYQLQDGEGKLPDSPGNSVLDLGGNRNLSTGVLSSWTGAASEKAVPYLEDEDDDWSVAEEMRSHAEARLLNADYLPGTAKFTQYDKNKTPIGGYSLDTDALKSIKQSLLKNGVIDVSYYADQSQPGETGDGKYITKDNKSQFTYDYKTANHEVSIVGWDDDYKKDNFIKEHQPEGDGAWIVKNSWGSEWGGQGYFYISYYDRSICDFTSFQIELPDADGSFKYDNNYQYDLLGMKSATHFLPDSSPFSIANIFTTKGESEQLEAVSAVTADPNSTVEIDIYKVADNSSPVNGTKVHSQTVTIPYGGYHTIELTKKIPLLKGEHFSVIQTIHGASGYYFPIEIGSNNSMNGYQDIVTCISGQSFYTTSDGVWYDNSDTENGPLSSFSGIGNSIIKAFTITKTPEVKPSLTELKLDCYDSAGKKIGDTVSCDITAAQTSITTLPSYTASIKIADTKFDANAPGKVQKVQVGGQDYTEPMIVRSALEGEQTLRITAASTPDGLQTADYTFNFTFPSTTLDGDNGNYLVDANGLLPQNLSFTTTQKSDGTAYEAVKKSLYTIGGADQFKLFEVGSKANDTAFELKSDQTAVLKFSAKDGYEKNAKLFYAELSGTEAVLTDITDTDSSTEALVCGSTPHLNGLYVLSLLKDTPEIPVLDSIAYSPVKALDQVPFPEILGGTWAWDAPDTIPTVAKEYYPATFTPEDHSEFATYKAQIKLTVTKAIPVLQTLSASPLTYGQTLSDSLITGAAEFDGVALTGSYTWKDKTTYPIVKNNGYEVVFQPSDTNYAEVSGNAAIAVTPKQIKAVASPAIKAYGDANPVFTFTTDAEALVGNDTKEALNVTLVCAADQTTPVGTYEISGSAASDNYEVTLAYSLLTIDKRPISLTPADVSITYGDAIPDTYAYTVDGLVNGDTKDKITAKLSAKADTKSPAGQYTISGEATADNYSIAVKNGTLTIKPIVLSQTNFGIINNSTLSNELLSKLTVSGSFQTTDKSRIVVTDIAANSEAYQAFAKQLTAQQKILLLADISLEGITAINGPIQITLPVDSLHEGKTVSVLHYVSKDKLDQNNTKASADMIDAYNGLGVQNGAVSVTACSLSPFAVVEGTEPIPDKKETSNTNNPQNGFIKTGDETSLAGPIIGMVIALIAIAAVVVMILKKRKK